MNWLLRAACRVYEREIAVHDEARWLSRRLGVSALFDLSDTGRDASQPQGGRLVRCN